MRILSAWITRIQRYDNVWQMRRLALLLDVRCTFGSVVLIASSTAPRRCGILRYPNLTVPRFRSVSEFSHSSIRAIPVYDNASVSHPRCFRFCSLPSKRPCPSDAIFDARFLHRIKSHPSRNPQSCVASSRFMSLWKGSAKSLGETH
jgi:hypothetical protein